MTIPRNLDKIGVLGSVFAALCCLGIPVLLSILSAVGLGFIVNDAILLPLLVIFLVTMVVGLISGLRHHKKSVALILGILSSLLVVAFLFVHFNQTAVQIGVVGLVLASMLNVWLQRRKEMISEG